MGEFITVLMPGLFVNCPKYSKTIYIAGLKNAIMDKNVKR